MTAPAKLPRWMRFDPVLWVIVALFVAFEFVAHFEFHNASGMQTLSHQVAGFVNKYGWPARLLVTLAVIALGIHLNGIF